MIYLKYCDMAKIIYRRDVRHLSLPPVLQVCVHRDDNQGDDAGWGRSEETRDAGHEAAPGLVRALELDGASQAALTGDRWDQCVS